GLTVLPGLTIANPVLPYIFGNLIAFILPIILILAYDKYKVFILDTFLEGNYLKVFVYQIKNNH
uniref:hypothetical protein n=1 Tax=Enterococcus faecium TaxID=1352 RepID=UPI0029307B3D